MSLFLITFLSLYSGMHAYAFFRLRSAFSPSHHNILLILAWMFVMIIAPVLVRLAEGAGLERIAICLAWPGYTWMGTLLIFTSALLFCDLLRGIAWLSHRFKGSPIPEFLTPTITCEVALMVTAVATAYAFYEARQIRTDHVTVQAPKLSPSHGRIRIVQISDVHIGLLFRESRLKGVVEAINSAHPDILVSTGDLVDGRLSREEIMSHQNKLADSLAAVPAPGGKFAVTGNHEFYAGLNQAIAFTRRAGFTVLRNQSVNLPDGITITGVDDIAIRRAKGSSPDPIPPEGALLGSTPAGNFHLLLKHRPKVPVESDGLFDLQLSGHVHKGQIFPFYLLVRLQYPIPCGTTATRKKSLIHVSRGTGTWGPPLRLFAPPEVTVIDIIPVVQNR